MNKNVQVYGFGSYFKSRQTRSNDVDLLILHADLSAESIKLALQCKQSLVAILPAAHITILSYEEERHVEFLRMCNALPLCRISLGNVQSGITALEKLIRSFDEDEAQRG